MAYSAFHLGDMDSASEYVRLTLRVNAKQALALYIQGRIERAQGAYAQAKASLLNALVEDPAHTEALQALSEIEIWQGDLSAAVESCRRGVLLEPDQAQWPYQLAQSLVQSGQYEEADQCFTRAIELEPNFAEAYVQRANVRLLHGVIGAGWRDLEWRIQARGGGRYLHDPRNPTTILLRPSTFLPVRLCGRRVLLVVDELDSSEHLFVRFIPMLKARGAWVGLWGANKLKIELTPLQTIDEIFNVNELPPPTDYTIGLGELPMLLEINKPSDIAAPPLLQPSREKVVEYRQRLREKYGNEPLLAVTWASNDTAPKRHALMAHELAPVIRSWKGAVVTLQPHVHYSDLNLFSANLGRQAEDVSTWIETESDALALVAALDNYVTVEQRWFHFRASLHRPVHVLVSHPAPWSMMVSGNRTPWWPTARLYRQSTMGDWSQALSQLRDALSIDGRKNV